jgi:hypothetical protein
MSHPNRGDRKRRQALAAVDPAPEELTASNLLPTLRAMREQLRGIGKGYFTTFEHDVADRLSDHQREQAATILRSLLMLCTALYDRLDIPSAVGFSTVLGFAPKHELLGDLLWAVDPDYLEPATRNALTYDAHRLELTELPVWLQSAVDSMFPQGQLVPDGSGGFTFMREES